MPSLKRAIFISRGEDDGCPEDLTPYEKLREMAANVAEERLDLREREVGLDDVINMQYTSGTTGFPKGVMLSSRNIVNNGYWLAQALGFTPHDRLCLCVPLFHCFGCVIGVLGAYTHGAALCAVESLRSSGSSSSARTHLRGSCRTPRSARRRTASTMPRSMHAAARSVPTT